MKIRRNTWEQSTTEAFVLIAGTAGLAEGLRAVTTTPGTYIQELVVSVSAVVLPIGLAALLLPPVVRTLKWTFGSFETADRAADDQATWSCVRLATTAALFAVLIGLVVVDAVNAVSPGAPAFVRAVFSFLLTVMVFAAFRHVFHRASVSRRLTVSVGLPLLLLTSVGLHTVLSSTVLPTAIDSGNQSPVADSPGWRGDNPPNILLIVLDTTRLDRLSLYGYELPTSPQLDRFGEQATVYERAISPAPWTLPSHASMFTGLLPRIHQATEEHRMLRDDFTTVAEILLGHGYETVGFSSNSVVGRSHNLQQGFQNFYEVTGDFLHKPVTPFQELLPVQVIDRFVCSVGWRDKGAEKANRLADRWLDQWEKSNNRRPFFAFVNYLEAHLPYRPPARLRSKFDRTEQRPEILPLVSFMKFSHGDTYRLIGYRSLLTDEDYRQLGAMYDASLAYQDERLGELIESIRRRGLLDQTVVIVVSDHGENLGDHDGLLGHAFSVHQTLVHVPLVVRFPEVFEPGSRYRGVVSIASLFPTILDLARAAPDPAWPPNVGLLPTSDDAGSDQAISEYSVPVWELYNLAVESRGVDIGPMIVRKQAIQDQDWKLERDSAGSSSLYHLAMDPDESTPLDPRQHDDGRRLLSLLEQRLDALARPALAPIDAKPQLDQTTREALRSLGYVQ